MYNCYSPYVTQFVSLEALMTSVTDLYPNLIRRGHRRELLLLFVCIICFLIGLVMITPVSRVYLVQMNSSLSVVEKCDFLSPQGGLYVFQVYDHFSCSGASLLLLSIFQSVAIGWIYGTNLNSPTFLALIFFKTCIPFSLDSFTELLTATLS